MSLPVGSKSSAASKLAAVTAIPEPKDINYQFVPQLVTYNYKGQAQYTWYLQNVTDVRVLPDTTQASTVEIDLDDSDYILLQDELFAHWAFDIQNVSLSSAKKFKTSRLTNSTNNAYLGDDADLEWVLGQRPIDFTIGQVVFRLCGITTADTVLTLTFEDRTASLLRDQEGFKNVSRGQMTRAAFVELLCREAGVEFWIPERDVSQPVEMSTSSLSPSQTRLVTGKGISKSAGLTVKGTPIVQYQIDAANILLDVGTKLNANTVALQAVICAAITESTLGNPGDYSPNSLGYWGVLQGGSGMGQSAPNFPPPNGAHDTVGMATSFFQGGKGFQAGGALHLSQTISSPGTIASMVEVGNTPAVYSIAEPEAAKIVQAYGGSKATGVVTSATGSVTTTKSVYSFTRGPNEDSYDAIQRLASEVAWYAFVRQNRLWYVSGNYLFQQDPQMTLVRGENGVDTIDLSLDMGARDSIAQCTVMCRADLWAALPGMVVQVNNRGPATGKWFVASTSSHPLDLSQQAQVTLQKPVPKRAEPAATDVSTTASASSAGTTVAASSTGNLGNLASPFTKKYTATVANTDMGVDFGMQQGIRPGDPILAIGDCYLRRIDPSWYSGQPCLFFELTDKSQGFWGWYVGEEINPKVSVGPGLIKGGTIVATFASSGTGIEIGWAASSTQTASQANGTSATRHSGSGTPEGNNFRGFLQRVKAI